jgi:ribonuclease G
MPGAGTIGISQRIEDEAERARLRDLVADLMRRRTGANRTVTGNGEDCALTAALNGDGYIVRTAAESATEELMLADMDFLAKLWSSVKERVRAVKAPDIVHEDLPLVIRTLRELTGTEIERARVDSRETMTKLIAFTERFVPEMVASIEHYSGDRPIFDLYGVEDEIQKALERKVQLKSGGHLIIDQTEAMTTIDVNTGAYVGHRNLEETIFKTNLEAGQAIARQLRLRNLGGIIIIDFIDMQSEEHKRQVLRALEKCLERDPTKTHISDVSALGLVQMTRKRTRESLEHVLCDPCPTCSGRGSIKTADTVCYEIFREILREARQFDTDKLLVVASQEVIDTLVDDESASFAELEAFIGKPITLQVESLYSREHYDVVLM